ncbi:MAG: CCA tRNA nucleotidyltransferase [Acidobacteria bacterium]|nr:CCA tRNA nucleotidyltransferase [Acidobacteriota bacterium]
MNRTDARLQEARHICNVLIAKGHESMLAGGCVRDRLLGRVPKDYDLVTLATPETVTDILSAQYQVIPTGLQHGTVTVVTSLQNVEVTTARADLWCDGRHAEVAWSDFNTDAHRRDFTINALFETSQGELVDYVGGVADARSSVLRFVGDPRKRLREDALRALRYFRLLAQLGWAARPDAIEAVHGERKLLCKLSKERVLAEWDRILSAPYPAIVVDLIRTDIMTHALGWWLGDGTRLASILSELVPCENDWSDLKWFAFFGESMNWSNWHDLEPRLDQLPLSRRQRLAVKRWSKLSDLKADIWTRCGIALKLSQRDLRKPASVVLPDMDVRGKVSPFLEPREGMPPLRAIYPLFEPAKRQFIFQLAHMTWISRAWSDLSEFKALMRDRLRQETFFLDLAWADRDAKRIVNTICEL